ncbi:COMM domain-containing protein 5-like [Clavelina lepadiformis]|uniref:COMM domain-containing protein 5-like n=1 Tax=Clavelina lepadiformis TaxID=159417 RepID=UPI004041123E
MTDPRERSFFIGKSTPAEVRLLSKHLKTTKKEVFDKLVTVACMMLTSGDANHEMFSEATKSIEAEQIKHLYPGILTIVRRGACVPMNLLKEKDFLYDLSEMKIPEKFHDSLVSAVFGESRSSLDEAAYLGRPRLPSIEEFRWRVDVGISTTSLKRALEPTILCNIKTDKNESHTFEMSKEKFHELRYAVAEVLNHIQQLEKRSVLKIET